MKNRGEQAHVQETSRILRSCSQKSAETTQLLPATKERATRSAYSVYGFTTRSVFFFLETKFRHFSTTKLGKELEFFGFFYCKFDFFFTRQIFDIKQMGKKNTQFCWSMRLWLKILSRATATEFAGVWSAAAACFSHAKFRQKENLKNK
jgi:hypothetical protein